MRRFHSITFAIGLALASVWSLSAWAVEPIEWMSRYTFMLAADDYGTSRLRFEYELAQHQQARIPHSDAVNSDLTREGHGFRQTSASVQKPQVALIC